MGLLYKKLIRPILFSQDPERAHDYAVLALELLSKIQPLARCLEWSNLVKAECPIELFGLTFPNRVGLAAGFDKNAECWKAMPALGFGHVEIGTITLHRQPGNPAPRIFRYRGEEAMINRFGFNNDGAKTVAQRLAKDFKHKHRIPLGINIGKSKATPLEEAAQDYIASFNLLADHADYFAINISSPNTRGLRNLQSPNHLPDFLAALWKANESRARKMGSREIPMLVKISPDLSFPEIDNILETMLSLNFSGIIATNSTLRRPGPFSQVDCSGGLSGRPLYNISLDIIKYIHRATSGKLPIIGVGGIMDPQCAGRMLDAGASLLQLYTGLIYSGPFFAKEIAKSLVWSHTDWV